jgi:hypothetical protein
MRKPTIPKRNENERLRRSPSRENLEKPQVGGNQTMGEIMDTLREGIAGKEPNRRISRIPQEQEEYLRPEAKRKDRQINMAKPTNLTKALIIMAKIRGTRARILINSGYLGNFMFPDFVKKA